MIFATAAVVACGGGDDGAGAGSSSGGSSGAIGAGGSPGSSKGGSGGDEDETTLNDAQIFKVVDTLHGGRIAEAKVAIARSNNPDVVAFATAVTEAHEQARAELAGLAKQRPITPADSKANRTRAAVSNVELGNLNATSSADFDAAYLQGQLADQERVVMLVASWLTMTGDGPLKAQLTALNKLTKDHQSQAKALLSAL